ncbi:archaeal ATPase [Galdieria sulphuraria]|uniref:Archaeal ATPase n=1 Tax=Galdieria sulphuraria TaxID=130081 RepID=M2XS66_GALSU|nr:archaeal ATPase [Galdieria sulphuraria]EME26508.1 archaeal ATPase [Galdieria sulphuraria]|eukprot:XP_005703028.1 archaeal ATPase [Galdieria sulphuraria]
MIDELSHLSYLTTYYSELTTKQFVESDPRYVPFRNFFRILRDLLITGKVIVYLAGRTAEISAPLSDARSSSVSLHMLRLNPFNLHDINEYIELATYSGKSLKDWLLPSDDLRHRFVELLKKKTGGIPLIVRNTLLALVEKVSNLSQPVINAENMELLLDSVFSSLLLESVTFIIPEILDSATLLRYQFVLLNYQLGTIFPIGFATTLCGTRTYLMDLVATFGFYSEICETDGIDLGTKFKIGCCEFILRAHSNYNFFREATELFPLSPFSYIPDTATAKGVFFEFIFMKIFRFRLLTFLHSSSSPIVHSAIPGIFQGSFIEQDNISYSMESTKSYDIPILRNCTRYDQSVGFSTEEQNIVEDASRFVTQHSSGSTLNESSRSCLQLVIVSQRNLEIYLGRDNVETLRKIGEANRGEFSKNFSVWCETVFESMSNEYVSPLEQSNVTLRVARNIRPRTNEENRMQMEELQSAMQVEGGDARGEQRVAASSSLSSSFDWNTFLREYCHFTEAPLIERYAHQLRLFSPLSFPYLNDTRLSRYGIAPQDIPLIVDGIHEFLEQQSMNVDLVER